MERGAFRLIVWCLPELVALTEDPNVRKTKKGLIVTYLQYFFK